MSSDAAFVAMYGCGEWVASGSSSVMSVLKSYPQAATEERWTTRSTPWSRAATQTFSVPPTLTRTASAIDALPGRSAAVCTTRSAP